MVRKMLAEAEEAAPSSSRSFGEALTQFLTWKKTSLVPTTFRAYDGYARREILPYLGKIPRDQIGTAQIDALYSRMTSAGNSYHVVKRAHDVVHAAYSQFVKWGRVDRNVAILATLPKAPTHEIALPTVEQLRVLLTETADVDQ